MQSGGDPQKEKQHLGVVLRSNGYPAGFIGRSSKPTPRGVDNGVAVEEPRATAVIPYVAGMSEDIRRICRGLNIRVAFRSSRTLRAMLSSAKDNVPTARSSQAWSIQDPLQLRKGVPWRGLETRLKEHKDACRRGQLERSAVAEHARTHQHPMGGDVSGQQTHGTAPEGSPQHPAHTRGG